MSPLSPMLATQVDVEALPSLVDDDAWMLDQKLDGQRRLVAIVDARPQAFGRRGTSAKLPRQVERDLSVLSGGEWLVDGELMDDVFWVFDVVRAPAGHITETTPYAVRRRALDGIAPHITTGSVHVLPCAAEKVDKDALVGAVRTLGCEGVVARHIEGAYEFGDRSRTMLKAKFFRDIDVVVTRVRVDGKENFGIGLVREGEVIEIGTCSALFRGLAPVEVGQVLTVHYLYANERGHLQHPTRPKVRNDKAPEECTFDQLIFRSRSIVERAT